MPFIHTVPRNSHLVRDLVYRRPLLALISVRLLEVNARSHSIIQLLLTLRDLHRLTISLLQTQRGSRAALKDITRISVKLWWHLSHIQDLIRIYLTVWWLNLRVPINYTRLPNSSVLILKVTISLILLRLFRLVLQKEFAPARLIVYVAINIILVLTLYYFIKLWIVAYLLWLRFFLVIGAVSNKILIIFVDLLEILH
jgi:hypothetical protein